MEILGIHPLHDGPGVVIRTLQLFAARVEILDGDDTFEMGRVNKDGLFEYVFREREAFTYKLRITDASGHSWTVDDPYRFGPQLTDFDLHLYGEGTNYRAYEKMGAHAVANDGVAGVRFAVWAPNAQRVSVVGPFNRWDGRHHPMQFRGGPGIWELLALCNGEGASGPDTGSRTRLVALGRRCTAAMPCPDGEGSGYRPGRRA